MTEPALLLEDVEFTWRGTHGFSLRILSLRVERGMSIRH